MCNHFRADFCVQICQLRSHMAALCKRRRDTGLAPPPKDLRDIGGADLQQISDLANPITVVSGRENALAQIL
jgi:hypothetical protein